MTTDQTQLGGPEDYGPEDYTTTTKKSLLSSNIESTTIASRCLVDVGSAFVAGVAVSPIVTAIDIAVTKKAFEPQKKTAALFKDAFKDLPHNLFSRPSFFMVLLYAGTYAVANMADTFAALRENIPPDTTTSSLTKFGLVSGVNVTLSLVKDSEMARFCGRGGSSLRMPLPCYGPLLIRDAISLYATFNLPAVLAKRAPENWDKVIPRLALMQLVIPVLGQSLSTPFHLAGLSLYHDRKMGWTDRFRTMKHAYLPATTARMFRVLPGLGIGNVANSTIRSGFMRQRSTA